MKEYSIRSLANDDLGLILSWRNHPSIRAVMLTQHAISESEHLSWFRSAKNNEDKKLLVCEDGGSPFGFVQFTGLKGPSGVVDWGFYLSPEAKRGGGKILGILALEYIFGQLGKNEVRGQAYEKNVRSIQFHERLGFKMESSYMSGKLNGKEHSLICFSLKKDEFLRIKKSGEVDV